MKILSSSAEAGGVQWQPCAGTSTRLNPRVACEQGSGPGHDGGGGDVLNEVSYLVSIDVLFRLCPCVQHVGPLLHHPGAVMQVFRVVVGTTDCVLFCVRQLPFDPVC